MLTFHILTLFPEMFDSVFQASIIKRAQEKEKIKINLYNLRDWATDKHKTAAPAAHTRKRFGRVDDKPYGGGAGMVLKVDVIDRALRSIKNSQFAIRPSTIAQDALSGSNGRNSQFRTILLTPQGKTFNQVIAKKLSKKNELILVCGHYEGFDERVRKLVDEEISIGQYILTGGEIPAMILVDVISRLIPGVLGKKESSEIESFSMEKFSKRYSLLANRDSLLEYPQYTRPEIYKNMKVPKILLSGDHAAIEKWRLEQAATKSKSKSP